MHESDTAGADESGNGSDHARSGIPSRSRQLIDETFPVFPSSLEELRRRLQVLRGRAIEIRITDPGDLRLPTGLWAVLGSDRDMIWVDATLNPAHQLVTICHEFGHMIYGHQPQAFPGPGETVEGISQPSVARLSKPATAPPTGVLGRCGSSQAVDSAAQRREFEAETLGRLLARPFVDAHHRELALLFIGH